MEIQVAKSPTEWMGILENIRDHLRTHLNDIAKIRIVGRCCNCFKKIHDITITFGEKELVIKNWSYNCNTNKEFKTTIKFEQFNTEDGLIWVDKTNPDFFQLKLEYACGSQVTIPLSATYDAADYAVHGTYLYKERNLKFHQRETEKGLVLLLQNFIDFKGLDPYYSDTIYIEFKDEDE